MMNGCGGIRGAAAVVALAAWIGAARAQAPAVPPDRVPAPAPGALPAVPPDLVSPPAPAPDGPPAPAPGSPEALAAPHVDEGFLEFRSRNLPAAIAAFERALAVDPGNRRARFGLGTAYISSAEYAKARDLLEGLAKDFSDDYAIRNNLAWLYATAPDHRVRDGRRALKYAQEVVLVAPKDHHVWSTLAEAFFINEKYEDALRAASESLRLMRLVTRDPAQLKEYERQVAKCRMAVQALSILE